MRLLAEIVYLLRWLLSTIKEERFRDELEGINADPSGAWADKFGRVRDGKDGSVSSDNAAGGQSELPSGDSGTTGRE